MCIKFAVYLLLCVMKFLSCVHNVLLVFCIGLGVHMEVALVKVSIFNLSVCVFS